MASSQPRPSPQMYTVGWITALDKELAAATAVLDEEHKKPKGFKKHPRDDNNYAWGRIGDHHVVIASMATGRYGIVSAATTAMQMVSSLPHLRFGLMVGIGAGVPRPKDGINIRLGDIVVSQPIGTSPGVVQYDLGKLKANGKFERVGSLAAPPEVLLKGLATLKAYHMRKGSRVPKILEKMFKENNEMAQDGPGGFRHPGAQYDQLFETSLPPQNVTTVGNVSGSQGTPSSRPSPPHERERPESPSDMPKIHYGIIASGNSVVKDGIARDEILKSIEEKCICFEMEAAGLMNNFPCLIIRGICDYADEHKNDRWQNYAAATAAAFAKELLEIMDSEDIEDTSPIQEAINELGNEISEIKVAQNETHNIIQSQNKEDHSRKLQRWLSASDPSINYNKALHQRHQGSGDWFLRSPEYSAWKTERDSFLWLYGMPGCGKTILSSTIIHELMEDLSKSEDLGIRLECNVEGRGQKRVNDDEVDASNPTKKQKNNHGVATSMRERQETHQPKLRSKDILLYFYFDFTDNRKQSLESILRALISQLCSRRKDLESDLSSLHSSCNDGNRQPSTESLRRTLLSMVEKAGAVRIIIDALDECQTLKGDPNEGLLGWMESIRSSQGANVHFLVTSRPEQDIQLAIEKWGCKKDTISIESDRTAKDIQDYVHARVRHSEGLSRWSSREDIQEEIETTLTEKAHGMFRWVSCQFDVLEDCYDPQTLRKALVSLPQTLGETYMRILANVPVHNQHVATRILQFLTYSQRPLSIDELDDAIAVDLEHDPSFEIKNRMPVPKHILRCCSSLVTFSEDTREVHLAHFSVKEFITSQEGKGVFTQSLKEFTAHESIIEVIVAYLLSVKEFDVDYNMAVYCGKHWVDHARIVEENSPSARKLLLKLFSNKEAWFDCSNFFNLDDQYGDWYWQFKSPDEVVEPLYIASLSGLKYLAKDLLRQGAKINAISGEFGTALRVACQMRHSDLARILIESGADMNIVSGLDAGTALVTAIDNNLVDIACLQINRGANPGTRGHFMDEEMGDCAESYPLHLACMRGAEEVVKALIDKNVDINLEDEDYGSPLRLACNFGHEKVVKLLLEREADIHVKFQGDTILHGAARLGRKHIVQLLLEQKADVNAQDDEGCTPLHTAARYAGKGLIKLLLEHRADVNAQDNRGNTPIKEAVEFHREDTVQLLLEHGADVHMMDRGGRTLLHTAAQRGASERIVLLLFEHGVDTHVQDQKGQTPLEIAERYGREQIAQMLRATDDATLPFSICPQEGTIGGQTSSA